MKKLLFIISIIPVLALGQSTDQNYVKSTTYKVATTTPIATPDADEATVQITYFDGLGRPIQQIAHKQSNTGKDIVTHIEYDQFGRQTKEFLPYATTAPSLSYIDAPTAIGDLNAFYTDYNGGTSNPFSEKLLENSPLSRVFKQASPGDAWAMGSGKEIKFDYQTNDSSDDVKLFKAVANWNSTNKVYDFIITDLGTYANNQLYKTITKDENWTSGNNNTTEEFKDKEGRVVLKRTFSTIMQSGTILEVAAKHDTYYIYDQYGNLTAVLPPLAEGSASQVNLDELGYQYKYDSRNRLIEKKLPGKQWEFIVYDNLDRPIATGPAFTPYGGTQIGWMITEYDVFGRVTQTGWKEMTVSQTERRSNQESIVGGTNPFILGANDILTKNYYDNYNYPNAPTLPSDVEGQTLATNVKGLPSGSWVKVLDANNPLAYEASYTLYDDRYRPVSSYTQNYLGGFTQVDSKLDWAGKTLYTVTTHAQNQYSTPIVITDTFEYTQQDRLQTHKQQINQLDEQLITANTYDELGQLISKNVGGDFLSLSALQKVDYTYNIRGWLKAINDIADITTENDLFAFKINYNDPSNAQALFNGNISEIFWKTDSDNTTRKYEFQYDHLNRLLEANYSKPDNASTPNNFKEHLNYDKNGNITQLQRNGDLDSNGLLPAMPIDDLTYTYHPQKANQLMKVIDFTNSPQGFKDGTNSDDDYSYDDNGNMTVDQNKGITNITYNHLNLPTEIEFGVTGKIEYLYNATGQKVAKIVTEGSSNITQHDYLAGGFQYKNSALQFFSHAEGYVNATQTRGGYMFNYVFNYTDHLGNIRVSYGIDPSTSTLKIIEENHYYPFGLKHTNYNSDKKKFVKFSNDDLIVLRSPTSSLPATDYTDYKYKYNGKEYQDELGLNMYDYGARNYDPALGRWMNIDPLAETSRRWSPYTSVYNNPLRFVDPDGMQGEDWIRKGNKVFYDASITTQEDAVAVYGEDAKILSEGARTYSVTNNIENGDYSYTYHNDGTVTDKNGENVDFSNGNVITKGGTEIVSPDNKSGKFSGFSIGGAAGGGISMEIGFVNDPSGGRAFYFTFGGNSGLGGGAGFKAGVANPTGNNTFSVSDFAGKGNSSSVGVDTPLGSLGVERGGSQGDNGFSDYGNNKRGYKYTSGSQGGFYPSLKAEAFISETKTWIFRID
jgi:RHS repeat-associated protein